MIMGDVVVWGDWVVRRDWVVGGELVCIVPAVDDVDSASVSGDWVVNGGTGHDNESGLSSRRFSREKICVRAILVVTCLVTLSSYAPNVR